MIKFFECAIPVTLCNLSCEYCYVIQEERRNNEIKNLKYPVEFIADALRKERLGGVCYFSLCGAGETLLPDYIIELTEQLLNLGHFVNITTNGTISNRISELIELDPDLRNRLHIAFSYHYDELTRTKNLDKFWNNVRRVKDNGISFVVQCNLCDSYIDKIDKIKSDCIDNIGTLPQFVATRDKSQSYYQILTSNLSKYIEVGKSTGSFLFDFTMNNINKKRCNFCYAGAWSYKLFLESGDLMRCYAEPVFYNIFQDINEPIPQEPVGFNCKSDFCLNASHFLTLGIMPDVITPAYDELRKMKNINNYSDFMHSFYKRRLYDDNTQVHHKVQNIYQISKPSDYAKLLSRPIIIYGAGRLGNCLVRKMNECGIKYEIICDSDKRKQINGVVSVEVMLEKLSQFDSPVIAVAITDDKQLSEVFYALEDTSAELCTYYTIMMAIKYTNGRNLLESHFEKEGI